jgi:hypothetical protein
MAPTVGENQAEVVLIGCGAPLRGMGWYHAVQMLGNECPSAKLCYIVEPWFLGGGAYLEQIRSVSLLHILPLTRV